MKKYLDTIYNTVYNYIKIRKELTELKEIKMEERKMTKRTYNLSNIMKKAWTLFKATGKAFAQCLRQAWIEAKAFIAALRKAMITEEVHTWYGWKELGYEVIHESKNVFQITVEDPNTKKGTRVLSYFTKSQVQPIEA